MVGLCCSLGVLTQQLGMATLRFTARMKIHSVNPYILVSAKHAAELKPGWRKPMPVLVQINGKLEEPWPST
jgi:hypothetical protein